MDAARDRLAVDFTASGSDTLPSVDERPHRQGTDNRDGRAPSPAHTQSTDRSATAGRGPIGATNRQRTPFEEAATRVAEHGRGLGSDRFPASRLQLEGDSLVADGRVFGLGEDGIRRLCGHLQAPADYLNRLGPKLRNRLLNHHLRSAGRARSGLSDANSRIIHRDGLFLDLGRTDLHTLGGEAVVGAIRDGFGDDAGGLEVQRLELRQESFGFDVVSPAIQIEVRPGDVLQSGVHVEHSYTGGRATAVMGYVVRLLCSNGMVQRECDGARRTARTRRLDAARHDAEDLQIEQIRRLTGETRRRLEGKLDAIRRLTQERADATQLEQFLRQARMHSQDLMARLRQSWAEEGEEPTAFGLLNALTRLATHDTELSVRQRIALSRLAGVYANRSQHLCPYCFSVLATPSRN